MPELIIFAIGFIFGAAALALGLILRGDYRRRQYPRPLCTRMHVEGEVPCGTPDRD